MDDDDSDVQIIETELIVEHLNLYNCDSCHYETPFPFALEAHQKLHHSAENQFTCTTEDLSGYSCKQCKYTSVLLINLLRHIREEHMQRRKRPRKLIMGKEWFPTSRNYYLGDHIYSELSECQEQPAPVTRSKKAKLVYERYTKYCVKVYICFKCDYSTRMLSRMEAHFCIHHTLDDLNLWMDYQKINTHVNSVEEKKWFKCEKCNYRSYRQNEVNKHFIHNHHNRLSCDLCFFRTTNPLEMDTHLKLFCKNAPKTIGIRCTIDGCAFRTKCQKNFDAHFQKCHSHTDKQSVKVTTLNPTGQHTSEMYNCAECHFQTDNLQVLDVHKAQAHTSKQRVEGKQHLNQRFEHSPIDQKVVQVDSFQESPWIYKCEDCDFVSDRKRPFQNHRWRHRVGIQKNADGFYACPLCPYKTKRFNVYKTHENQRHKKNKTKVAVKMKYTCEQCEYTAQTQHAVRRHVYLRHTPDELINWHRCRLCKFKAKERGNLNQHMASVHSDIDLENIVF